MCVSRKSSKSRKVPDASGEKHRERVRMVLVGVRRVWPGLPAHLPHKLGRFVSETMTQPFQAMLAGASNAVRLYRENDPHQSRSAILGPGAGASLRSGVLRARPRPGTSDAESLAKGGLATLLVLGQGSKMMHRFLQSEWYA
jgi:hypothetical protein